MPAREPLRPREWVVGAHSRTGRRLRAARREALAAAGSGQNDGVDARHKRGAHSSGELVIADGVRDRRARGSRVALDWNYFRLYAFVPLILMIGFAGGIELVSQEPWWQRLLGVALLLVIVLVIGSLVRWLMRPVDPASKERVRQYHDEMRLQNL